MGANEQDNGGTTLATRVHELPLAVGDACIFISVADTGSFTAAAALYGLSPSAVSKAVSRLESALGVRLMVGTTRALHLTKEGGTFHARCSKTFQLLAEAAEEAMQLVARSLGYGRAGVAHLPARGKLARVLVDVDPPAKLASFVYAAGRSIPGRVRVVIEHLRRGEILLPGTSLP